MGAIAENKNCKQCGEQFKPLRKDAQFCSATCRWIHWKFKNEKKSTKEDDEVSTKKEHTKSLMDSLQGIVPDEPQYEEKEIKKPNQLWWDKSKQKIGLIKERDELKKNLNQLQQQEIDIKNETGDWMIFTGLVSGAIGGGLLGHAIDNETKEENATKNGNGKSKKQQKKSNNNNSGSLFGALIGTALGGLIANGISNATKEEREVKKQKALSEIQPKIIQCKEKLKRYDTAIKEVTAKADAMPKWLTTKERKLISIPDFPKQISTEIDKSGLSKSLIENPKNEIRFNNEKDGKENLSEKIISCQDLQKMDYKALFFKDKWADFFGRPSLNFHCVIHGMSGEGKSTFAIQFANYLAENFGKVVYVSGEEGFSKTFKDKFTNNNAVSENLFVADLRKLDDVLKEVPNDEFNFIFVDSLDNMRIDADGMKKLRKYYKDSALITISQSTKDGKMRGSYEIVYDSDIAVKVENGIASTTKNRFMEKGMKIRLFGNAV